MRGSHAVRLAVALATVGVALPPLSRAQTAGTGGGGGAARPTAAAAASPAAPAAPSAPAASGPAVMALKAARLFDGRSDHWVRNGVVVVAGGKIQAVGAGAVTPSPACAATWRRAPSAPPPTRGGR